MAPNILPHLNLFWWLLFNKGVQNVVGNQLVQPLLSNIVNPASDIHNIPLH